MRSLLGWIGAAGLVVFVLAGTIALPLRAEDPPAAPDAPWQDVITGQIQAFRDHDARVAFSYAGAAFQVSFPTAEAFFNAIVSSGYAPIMESSSHSFGPFQRLGDTGVIQQVRLVGKDQALYTATYRLTREEAGWRVQGVQLAKEPGIAI